MVATATRRTAIIGTAGRRFAVVANPIVVAGGNLLAISRASRRCFPGITHAIIITSKSAAIGRTGGVSLIVVASAIAAKSAESSLTRYGAAIAIPLAPSGGASCAAAVAGLRRAAGGAVAHAGAGHGVVMPASAAGLCAAIRRAACRRLIGITNAVVIASRARTSGAQTSAIAPVKIVGYALGLRRAQRRGRGALIDAGAAISRAARGRFGWIANTIAARGAAATGAGLTHAGAPERAASKTGFARGAIVGTGGA